MREIKFRFWNAQGMRFHYDQRQVLSCLTNQVCGGYDYTIDDCTFEQFTGLRDKNGRDIYEGDILVVGKYFDLEDGDDGPSWIDESIHEVKWMGDSDYPAFDLSPSIDTDCNGLAYIAVGEQVCEVIGNIHENPELVATA